ncbi:MAG: hypothetical protein M3O70_00275 [Actinomycetota bacterium]|nr:hypothetical protein [Actinomycetota bacterium]
MWVRALQPEVGGSGHGTLTSSIINGGRSQIRSASRLLAWVEQQDSTISDLAQGDLERYLAPNQIE